MKSKAIYWTSGIAVVALILLIYWGVSGSNRNTGVQTDHTEAGASAVENLSSYMNEENELMNKMMQDMEDVKPTGSADLDFLTGMIPHHQAAVSMSESYLKYGGSDDELRQLAENIIQVQKQEIQQMQTMIDDIKKQGTQNSEHEQAYLNAYEKMLSAHHADHSAHKTPGNVDAAFTEGMIMHHQMAVEMAQAVIGNADEEQVTTLAENIIEAQKTEISQMQEILNRVSASNGAHH